MRTGLMIGSDREHSRGERLSALVAEVQAAEKAGFASVWIPQVPGYLDALTAVAVLGWATERIELATSVVPIQSRHPIALAQQALTTQLACGGRFRLGLGPSHHWLIGDQWGLRYERPARLVRDYLEVLHAAFAGPGTVAPSCIASLPWNRCLGTAVLEPLPWNPCLRTRSNTGA